MHGVVGNPRRSNTHSELGTMFVMLACITTAGQSRRYVKSLSSLLAGRLILPKTRALRYDRLRRFPN